MQLGPANSMNLSSALVSDRLGFGTSLQNLLLEEAKEHRRTECSCCYTTLTELYAAWWTSAALIMTLQLTDNEPLRSEINKTRSFI